MKDIIFYIGDGTYPSKVGGMEIFNYYLIKSLSYKFPISYIATKKYDYEGPEYIKSLNLRPIRLFFPFLLLFLLLRNRTKYDKVVFSYSAAHWSIWYSCYLVTKLLKKPYITVIHYGKQPPIKKESLYKKFFQNAEHVIAVSKDIKKNFDSKYGINSTVIFPLVPFSLSTQSKEELRAKYQIPINANILCMVGSVKTMKNPDTVLEAVAMMNEYEKKAYRPFILYVGSGHMVEELKMKIQDLGLSNYVKFLGFVPKERVNEIMRLSDIYVIASDFEGTSVSLLEAMYNKMPIIASEVPGITDTISEHECRYFPLKNAASMKDAITDILSSGSLRERISEAAYKRYLREYKYDNMIANYVTILNQ